MEKGKLKLIDGRSLNGALSIVAALRKDIAATYNFAFNRSKRDEQCKNLSGKGRGWLLPYPSYSKPADYGYWFSPLPRQPRTVPASSFKPRRPFFPSRNSRYRS